MGKKVSDGVTLILILAVVFDYVSLHWDVDRLKREIERLKKGEK